MKLFASIASILGAFIAAGASSGCYHLFFDEPEMPESLL